MATRNWLVGLVGVLLVFGGGERTTASIVVTGTPDDSWSYSLLDPANQGASTSYYPQLRSDFEDAIFQDFVTYSDVPTANWHQSPGQVDSIHLFTTYALATEDLTLPMALVGDDGHSLFLDETFIGGALFGDKVKHDLVLQAWTPTKIEVVGYNAGGPWLFAFRRLQGGSPISGPIDEVPGVYLNAEGDFSAIPEPTTFVTWGGLLGMGLVGGWWRKRRGY